MALWQNRFKFYAENIHVTRISIVPCRIAAIKHVAFDSNFQECSVWFDKPRNRNVLFCRIKGIGSRRRYDVRSVRTGSKKCIANLIGLGAQNKIDITVDSAYRIKDSHFNRRCLTPTFGQQKQ